MPAAQQRLGEYVLTRPLGRGTFGEVWLASHHAWPDERVAIKIPNDPQYLRNLQQEGLAIRRLSHPNIVKPVAFDPFAEVPYLAMEYVPGVSLRGLLSGGPLAPADAVAVMRQVLAGLGHAHDAGVVHRDVKPENVLVHERWKADGLSAAGVIKLTDFGLGNAPTRAAQSILISREAALTALVAGTQHYIAPEQFDGAPPEPRTDVYACGVVLFEMLTGVRPVGVELPRDVNPAVPAHLDEAYRRAVARRERRFASAAEMLSALAGPAAPPPASVAPAPARWGPHEYNLFTNSAGMKLAYVPPGSFLMGSPDTEKGRSDAEVRHRVTLTRGFYLGTTPVTRAQWKGVTGHSPGLAKPDDHPVTRVSWGDAEQFCRDLSAKENRPYRLSTEAEWEYACRAGAESAFCFGDDESKLGEYAWHKLSQLQPAGKKKPNAWGLHDMHGNVWEWCADYLAPYATGDAVDPKATARQARADGSHVVRGGSWRSEAHNCRSACRFSFGPDAEGSSLGFRVCLDLP